MIAQQSSQIGPDFFLGLFIVLALYFGSAWAMQYRTYVKWRAAFLWAILLTLIPLLGIGAIIGAFFRALRAETNEKGS